MKKKIPYGISNFCDLILQNYYFVDKTMFIETLENYHEKYLFFLRPRRFGKSLFVSVLEYYYDRSKAELFDKLFKDLYIGHHPTPLKSNYYILSLDFSGISTKNESEVELAFDKSIYSSLKEFIKRNELQIELNPDLPAASLFNNFLKELNTSLDAKLYVLIDEYDHFTSELLGYKKELFEEIVSKSGFFRKFFEVLKIGTKTIVDRIFITGVSPFTLDSLTSGFNMGSDLTTNAKLNEMLGFTEEEIITIFKSWEIENTSIEQTLPIMKKNYNGYLFAEDAKERVYNSDMVLYYLKDFLTTGNPPDELIDTNIATSYYKIKQYIHLGNPEENLMIIQNILEGNTTYVSLTQKFDLGQRFTTDDLMSVFFYMGLLTITDSSLGLLEMNIPNYVIKELYFSFFNELIEADSHFNLNVSAIKIALMKLAKDGNILPLVGIAESMLKKLSKRDFIKFDEKYVKLVFLTYCLLSKMYYVKSEYEVEGGYIDIALLPNDVVKPSYYAIIELKYCKKEGFTDELLKGKITEAEKQLAKYTQAEELANMPNLLKFIVVFKGEECVYSEQWSSIDKR